MSNKIAVVFPGANHSLETENVLTNIEIMGKVMGMVDKLLYELHH